MRVTKHIGLWSTFLFIVLLCTFCDDRLGNENNNSGGNIGFKILTDVGGRLKSNHNSVSDERHDTIAPGVFLLSGAPGTDPPLYLHATFEGGIGQSSAKDFVNKTSTRAAPITTVNMYNSFGTFAYIFPNSSSWSETLTPDYMYNIEVLGSNNWTTSYYWPGADKKIRFFMYAPYNCSGLTLQGRTIAGTPVISYITPSSVTDQKDLLVASTMEIPGNNNTTVPVEFKHCLTAVRFVVGDDMLPGTVTQISLKGVYGQGNYKIGETAWSAPGGVKNFSQTLNVTSDGTPDSGITTPEATFMMIPQTLPSGASVEIIYTDNLTGTQRTLTALIEGSAWPIGNTVTYRVSTSSILVTPTLVVTAPDHYSYAGGSQNYTVASYLKVSRSGDPTKTIPVAWSTEFSEDGVTWSTTKPDWLTNFTINGAGGALASAYTSTVSPQSFILESVHNDILRSASPLSNYDLSTNGGITLRSTANCYLVNAPGTYRLPLVYGNAIKNGVTNSSAYTSSISGTEILTNFVNHLDAAITDPFIYNNSNCTPANCTLIWQDEPSLITNVALSSDNQFLTFTVPQNSIRQGNAIVAVRDGYNNIMWSWHIWVTDYVLGANLKVVTNFQNNQYTFLPVNIGWCDGGIPTYKERSVLVRFTQVAAGVPAIASPQYIAIQQDEYSTGVAVIGNHPYYQFGRKDPMLPGIVNASNTRIDKSCYATDNSYLFDKSGTGKVTIGTSIMAPNKFFNHGSVAPFDWCSMSYRNLWSADNNTYSINGNVVIKTIYDPSPSGYCLPPNDAYTGLSSTGTNTKIVSQFNVSGSWDNGWNFYCGLDKTGEIFYFVASDLRNHETGIIYPSIYKGYYYTALPGNSGACRCFSFSTDSVYPIYTYGRSYGFAVRSIQEF